MTYAEGIVKTLLSQAHPGVNVYTVMPMVETGTASNLPMLVASRLPSGERVDPRFPAGAVTFQLDGFAGDKREAHDLCASAGNALVTAWRRQTQTPDGAIGSVLSLSTPYPLQVGESGVYRYTSTARLTV